MINSPNIAVIKGLVTSGKVQEQFVHRNLEVFVDNFLHHVEEHDPGVEAKH